MGYGMSVICQNCGNQEDYMLGIGMSMVYSSLDAILVMEVPLKLSKRIREILNTCELPISEYEHRLYACPKCNTLHRQFYINIRDKGVVFYESQFR